MCTRARSRDHYTKLGSNIKRISFWMTNTLWPIAKKVSHSLFYTLILSVVGILVNHFVQMMIQNKDLILPKGVMSTNHYENEIASHIVKSEDIVERLNDIGGLTRIKDDIRTHILLPLKYPHVFFSKNESLHPNKGILLCGPPGVGKTMIARAIAAEANVPFISLTLSVLENKYFGETSKLLAGAFSLARRIQPCILFFDEIDGLIRNRSDSDQSCVYSLKTELLTHMDGLTSKKNDAVFFIGCTNIFDSLDPAIRRRLSKVYKLELPDENERLEILKVITNADNIDVKTLHKIAKSTDKMSGSDIMSLYKKASSFRLTDQYKSKEFLENLELATSSDDMSPFMHKINDNHWKKALNETKNTKNYMSDSSGDESEHEPLDTGQAK